MTPAALPDGRIPVLLTAHEEQLIGRDAAAIGAYLQGRPQPAGVAAVAATLLQTRPVRRHRAVVRAGDKTELAAGLAALAAGDEHPLVARSAQTAPLRNAFVFPGQGNQWPSMGADAYHRIPAYRAEADRCASEFTAAGLPSPLEYLLGSDRQHRSQMCIQSAQFTHAVGLAQVWRSWKVLPDVTVGHSLGEVAAAYAAGVITLADAVAVIAARATVVDELPGHYKMAVLGTGLAEAEQLAAETPGWLEVSVVNSPSSTALSGESDAVAAVVRCAQDRGIFVRELDVDFPAHTSALEPLRPTLERLLPASAFAQAPVGFIGSATGGVVGPGTDFICYWYENLRNTVRFDRAVSAARRRGAGVFVELSAHPSLQYALADLADPAPILGSGRRDQPIIDELSANITAAAVADPGYRWAQITETAGRPLPGFPNAPMRAIHLWAKPEPLPDDAPAHRGVITAAERWVRQPATPAATQTRCGVAIVTPGPTESAPAPALRRAVAAQPACHLATPAEADIVMLIAPALRQTGATAAAGEIIAGAGLPDYRTLVGPRCRSVWLLTTGGERAADDDPAPLPAQAALAAMHRCVGVEFGEQIFGHVDIPSADIGGETARACVNALFGEASEVCLRESGHYIRTLHIHRQRPPDRPLSTAALDNVVITGGNGTIGLAYARHCIDHGARRVILLSRTGVEPASLKTLTDRRPVEVHAPECDITDADALSAVAAECAAGGASLLIHAAGVGRFGRHDQLTAADRAAVFGAKVAGLEQLSAVWPLRHDARILVCSSVSGVWGGHGHSAYAGANRMLDALAAQLRGRGLDTVAVRWGLWQNTGIVDAEETARIARSGLLAMTPEDAVTAGLSGHHDDPLVFDADLARLRVFLESAASPMPATGTPDSEPDDNDVATGAGEAPVDAVRAALATTLSLPEPSCVDLDAALIDLGVDSLLALDLRKRLNRSTGRSVAPARLLGGITGAELIDTLRAAPPEKWGSPRD
jgi:mycobactin polyketide synthetase MbtD